MAGISAKGTRVPFGLGKKYIYIIFQIFFVLLYCSVVKVMKVNVSAKKNVFKPAINSDETGPEEVRAQTHRLKQPVNCARAKLWPKEPETLEFL